MKQLLNLDYTGRGQAEQMLDVSLPEKDGFDTLIWFHGGGFQKGNKTHPTEMLADALTDAGCALVSPEYRMMPEFHYPDFLYDAARAVRYTLDHVKEWGGSGKVYVGGSSAGAYLTMMLYLNDHYYRKAEVDSDEIAGYFSESGQMFAHFNILNDRGLDGRLEKIDETAPIYYVHEGMAEKPLFLLYYTEDMLCRPEENMLMLASLKRFVAPEYLGSIQLEGKHCSPARPEERVEAVLKFIKQY